MFTPDKMTAMLAARDLWNDLIAAVEENKELKSANGVLMRQNQQAADTIDNLDNRLRLANELHAEYVTKAERAAARAQKSIEDKERALRDAASRTEPEEKPGEKLSEPLWLTRITLTKDRMDVDPVTTVSAELLEEATPFLQHFYSQLADMDIQFHAVVPQDNPWVVPAPTQNNESLEDTTL